MKRLGKFVVSIVVVLLLTVVFAMPALAKNIKYSITYKTSTNSKTLINADYLSTTQNTCYKNDDTKEYTDPKGCTAKEIYDGYQFVRWIEEGTTSLPKGWYTEDDGITLKFNPTISGAERTTRCFVAEYKAYVEPSSEEETTEPESEPTTEEKLTEPNNDKPAGSGKGAGPDKDSIIDESKPETLSEATTETTTQEEKPNTGDNNNMVLWIVIAGIALVAVIVVIILVTRRRK